MWESGFKSPVCRNPEMNTTIIADSRCQVSSHVSSIFLASIMIWALDATFSKSAHSSSCQPTHFPTETLKYDQSVKYISFASEHKTLQNEWWEMRSMPAPCHPSTAWLSFHFFCIHTLNSKMESTNQEARLNAKFTRDAYSRAETRWKTASGAVGKRFRICLRRSTKYVDRAQYTS